jgi:hypothetical protein
MRNFDTVAVYARVYQVNSVVEVETLSGGSIIINRHDVLMINGYVGRGSYCTIHIKRTAAINSGLAAA